MYFGGCWLTMAWVDKSYYCSSMMFLEFVMLEKQSKKIKEALDQKLLSQMLKLDIFKLLPSGPELP